MIIRDVYSPRFPGQPSVEDLIAQQRLGDLQAELRRAVTETQLTISDHPRVRATGSLSGLPRNLNKGLGAALTSLGWSRVAAPGAAHPQGAVDWAKLRQSNVKYMRNVGLAVEIQLGNNFQTHGDIQRLIEAILSGNYVAGIAIVASDSLERYKADRGASFSDAKAKLDRWLAILAGYGAVQFPPIMIWGIEHDRLTPAAAVAPSYQVHAPIYGLDAATGATNIVRWEDYP